MAVSVSVRRKKKQSLFTSESVSEGHPDKVCDRVSDAIVDTFLARDPNSRVAVEALATTGRLVIAGEVRSDAWVPRELMDEAARWAVKEVGYDHGSFNWQNIEVLNFVHAQSADIAAGVDADGAGDQGLMFGYAVHDGVSGLRYMPPAVYIAHRVLENIAIARHAGKAPGLLPDAKSQITLRFEDGKPVGAEAIVVSCQHQEHLTQADVRALVRPLVEGALPDPSWFPKEERFFVNPTGRFVIGGPDGDTGLTGRKIIVDTYGGSAPHGGGAFSGKDPTKVDRSAAYMARYLAKNVVAAGLASECLIQLAYAIGVADPVSFTVDTRGTGKVDEAKLTAALRQMVPLTPRGLREHLKLCRPIYKITSSYGHFGRAPGIDGTFPWEQLDLVQELKGRF
ncbi:S-adenosylmethionine synthase 2 [Alphaproteobacteria bacterium]|nr:S-adenosylmethionine synthase 2 [Alphaproteobacteria bacterium]